MTKNGKRPDLELSPASALKRKIERVRLPISGAVVDLCRPSLFMLLAKAEKLPDTLLTFVVERIEEGMNAQLGGKPRPQAAQSDRDKAQIAKEGLDLMKALVVEAIVAPRVVLGPAENGDEISVDDLEQGDMEHIYNWVQGVRPSVRDSFRQELVDGVGDLPAGEDVREDAGADSGT